MRHLCHDFKAFEGVDRSTEHIFWKINVDPSSPLYKVILTRSDLDLSLDSETDSKNYQVGFRFLA